MSNIDLENNNLLDFIVEHDTAILYALETENREVLEDVFSEFFDSQNWRKYETVDRTTLE